jgi:hypothetical protein
MPASNAFYASVAKQTPNGPTIAPLNASVSIGISITIFTHSSVTVIAWIDQIVQQTITTDTALRWIYATQGIPILIAERPGWK